MLTVQLEQNGKTTFYKDGSFILEEKPEMTFNSGFRCYENKGSGLWSARVTFEGREGEHLYGLGHEASGCLT